MLTPMLRIFGQPLVDRPKRALAEVSAVGYAGHGGVLEHDPSSVQRSTCRDSFARLVGLAGVLARQT